MSKSKETTTNTEVTTVTDTKKKPIRRADLESQGRLYVDENLKEKGFTYRIVNDKPGRVKLLERMGYEIVRDETKVGTESSNTVHQLGSAVTLEAGIHKSQLAVLMRCPDDIYNERQKEKGKENTAMFTQTVEDNRYRGQSDPE